MSWSCDAFGLMLYRERIAVSDGNVRCCESGILIPKGFPYADCRCWWSDGSRPTPELAPYLEEDGLHTYPGEDIPTDIVVDAAEVFPQAIEVWRLLRNDSRKRGACPSWENAVEEYRDAASYYDKADRLALARLLSTISRTSKRYAEGKPPRLHAHEQASLESGEFVSELPFSIRAKEKAAA